MIQDNKYIEMLKFKWLWFMAECNNCANVSIHAQNPKLHINWYIYLCLNFKTMQVLL